MRSSRLMALLLHLQAHGRATAGELAAQFEVSVRTVRRDVAALAEAGVPLWSEPGPHGGIRLVEGWRTNLDGLTGDEASALLLAGAGGDVLGGLGLETVAAAAQTKILATLPPELRARAGRVRERFHLDAPGWFGSEEPVPHLAVVAGAVWSGQRITVRYGRPDRTVERSLEPLGLVLKAGVWYLVARGGSDVRSYRIGRIVEAAVRSGPEGRFTRPADFHLARWWVSSNEDFARSLLRWPARLSLSPRGLRSLPGVLGPLAGQRALATAGEPDADGWREVEVWFESPDVAESQLWAFGPHVRVLAPDSLREALARTAQQAAANNGAPKSG
ncbi:YafY family transcriptional regulator [Frankia sp. Mgl5]|uniref:helix-turn-helix transcriptional regulator n=1 Tax=Frankia sp. Mgl5 TaxID=2933793 RepID=UPI002010BD5F|nr:YafY family protein [Frankia sp. Mgl5]MCK9928078.1 YafY family transcriptional regulator [Frankia sp. Mgl5]